MVAAANKIFLFFKKNPSLLLLLLIIVVAFVVFLIVDANRDVFFSDDDSFFPDSYLVPTSNHFVRVAASEQLLPNVTEDFILLTWFSIKKYPEKDKKIMFITKFDVHHPARRGYMIGYMRDDDSMFPIVHWKDSAGRGEIYQFSDFAIVPGKWIMLALSFQEARFLGLHGAIISGEEEKPELKLLGGYEFEQAVVPTSSSDLILGALKSGRFKGRLGPFGIFSKGKIGEDLKPILEEFLANPLQIPSAIDEEAVKLWVTDSVSDLSSFAHKVDAKTSSRYYRRRKKAANKKLAEGDKY